MLLSCGLCLAVRIGGGGWLVARDSEAVGQLLPHFDELWVSYLEQMQEIVCIDIEACELITSSAYDVGFEREQRVKVNLEKFSKLSLL